MAIIIDLYSVAAVPIQLFFNEKRLSLATSFTWNHRGIVYLITNWHNFSGIDPVSGNHLSTMAAEPNRVGAFIHTRGQLGHRFQETFALRDGDNKPTWLVHPTLGSKIDVVALQIVPNIESGSYHINDLPSEDLAVEVGHDIFVLGYPFGVGPGGFPIWKRGSIASEPRVFSEQQRYILVDTASRPGMSGSPVIRRSWGTHLMASGATSTIMGDTISIATKFIGVYSGRLHTKDSLDAQLGLVWPAHYITEIIEGAQRDR
jgi:trypsin-like peptidase